MSAEPQCPGCRERDEVIRLMRASFEARITELEQRVRELEAQLKQNSSNSSRPPSSDPPQASQRPSKPPTGRKPGGQPGHPGHSRERLPLRRVDAVVHHWPAACERCQRALPQTPQAGDPEPTWHQVAEVPLVPAVVTEHQGHGSRCPDCGHCTWAEIPADIRAHAFGVNLTALVAFLSVCCRGSQRIIEEFVETVFQIPVSLGTVANLERNRSPPCSGVLRGCVEPMT